MKLIFKLARDNIKRNKEIYIPYVITLIISIVIFFLIINLSFNDIFNEEIKKGYIELGGAMVMDGLGAGYEKLKEALIQTGVITGIVSLFFNLYSENFIGKRRAMDYGLYNVFGLDVKKIELIILFEKAILNSFSIVLGIIIGILLDKLNFLILAKVLGFGSNLKSEVSLETIIITFIIFLAITAISYIVSIIRLKRSETLELLYSKNTSTKSNRFYLLIGILGIIILLLGYYFSYRYRYSNNNINDRFLNITDLAIVVILIVIGTYFILQGITVIFLNRLKKKDKVFKKKGNFIAISNLINRFKSNSLSLTIMSILSSAILIFIFIFIVAYNGFANNYKGVDYSFNSEYEEDGEIFLNKLEEIMGENYVEIDNYLKYRIIYLMTPNEINKVKFLSSDKESERIINIISLSEYNRITKEKANISNDETILLGNKLYYEEEINKDFLDYINIFNDKYSIVDKKDVYTNENLDIITYAYTFVVGDNAYSKIKNEISKEEHEDRMYLNIEESIVQDFKFKGDSIKVAKCISQIEDIVRSEENPLDLKGIYMSMPSASFSPALRIMTGATVVESMYIAIIFLINFLTVIYYKQIVEGYDDAEQFKKLYRIGLTNSEIKNTVNKQIRIFFFIPLLISLIHFVFIFGLLTNIATFIDIVSRNELVTTAILSILIYSLIYSFVYLMTSRKYYNIILTRTEKSN